MKHRYFVCQFRIYTHSYLYQQQFYHFSGYRTITVMFSSSEQNLASEHLSGPGNGVECSKIWATLLEVETECSAHCELHVV